MAVMSESEKLFTAAQCGHYTSMAGLMGIVGTELLWATNIKFLNDEHEFQHALDLVKQLMESDRVLQNRSDNPEFAKFVDQVKGKVKSLDDFRADSVFTFSFSEETDLLSQWRGYCPGNNGYCIKFDLQELFQAVKGKYENVYLFPCVYDYDDKRAQLVSLLNEYWQQYVATGTTQQRGEVIESLTTRIQLLASHFKHPSFKEEKEHRIVVLLDYAPGPHLKFRAGSTSLVPYIELPSPRKTIKRICIGPTANRQLARRSLEVFLETHGIDVFFGAIEVVYSDTPYRPW